MSSTNSSETAYCSTCGETREIKTTVPWQNDICTACGNDIDDT